MATLTTTPPNPVPGRPCKVRVTATAGGSAIRIWCSDAPRDSALRKKLDETGAAQRALNDGIARVAFNPPTVESGKDFEFTPDKGGGYVLQLDELERGSGFTGDYEGDPRGAPTERLIAGGSGPATLYVAEEFTSKLGAGPDTATLVLHVFNDIIMQARKDVHGVVSPRIDLASQPSAKARIAAESQVVRNQLRLFVNPEGLYPPDLVLGDPSDIIDRLIAQFNAHIRSTAAHASRDEDNEIDDEFLHPTTPASMAASLTKLKQMLDRHVRNDSGSGTGSAEDPYHEGVSGRVSWNAIPLITPSESNIDAAIGDLNRCMLSHLPSSVHTALATGGVGLHDEAILAMLHQVFMQQLVALDPVAPANSNPLSAKFIARGFTAK